MKPAARRKARILALQAIYSWQLSGNAIADIEQQMLIENHVTKIDVEYFKRFTQWRCRKIISQLDEGWFHPHLNPLPFR